MGIRNALQEMMNVLESIDVEMSEDEGHLTHIELEADIAIWDEFESTADVFPNAFPGLSPLNFEDAEPDFDDDDFEDYDLEDRDFNDLLPSPSGPLLHSEEAVYPPDMSSVVQTYFLVRIRS